MLATVNFDEYQNERGDRVLGIEVEATLEAVVDLLNEDKSAVVRTAL